MLWGFQLRSIGIFDIILLSCYGEGGNDSTLNKRCKGLMAIAVDS